MLGHWNVQVGVGDVEFVEVVPRTQELESCRNPFHLEAFPSNVAIESREVENWTPTRTVRFGDDKDPTPKANRSWRNLLKNAFPFQFGDCLIDQLDLLGREVMIIG